MPTEEHARCGGSTAGLPLGSRLDGAELLRALSVPPVAVQTSLPTRVPEGDELMCAVAGVLCLAHVLRPQERIRVREWLAAFGIWADAPGVFHSVERLRRRGFVIDAREREPGYRLVAWRHRFRRPGRGPQMVLFRRAPIRTR